MSNTPHQLRIAKYVQNWLNTGATLTADNWAGIASVIGYRGDGLTNNTSTDPQTTLADGSATPVSLINASTSANTGGGVHEITDDVVALQGSGTADAPHLVFYLDSTDVQNVRFQATLRELDATTIDQKFAVQYRVGGTGNFINLPAGAVSNVFNAAGNQIVSLDVLLPAAANNQPLVEIRIITNDAGGADAMVGIDDINISSEPLGPVTPTLNIDDVSIVEGNSGTSTVTFTVTLSAAAGPEGVTFKVSTLTDTATTADGDFVALSNAPLSIAAGQTSATFTVTVNGDTIIEADEKFYVNVTEIVGATGGDTQGMGTIQNDDVAPIPAASIGDVAIVEGQSGVSYLVFTVSLNMAAPDAATIQYASSNGTAAAGSDYLAVSGTISFAAGESVKTITVPIVGDRVSEASETLIVTLSNETGVTIADGSATGTITNDDGRSYFPLATGNFSQDWTNTSQITQADDWSGVPHITGYLGDYTSDSPTGVDPRTLTAASTLGNVDVIANLNAATSSSGGVGEFQIANPTIGIQGSGTADAPSIVLRIDAGGRSDVRLQATLRDLDATDDTAQPINVQYRTDPNADWTNVPGGYFADVTAGGSATLTTSLDVTLPPGANNVSTLEIRIMTVNAVGSDEWVGIDDIVVSSTQSAANYSIADTAAFEGTGGTTPISFTVTRSGDATAAGSVDYALSFAGTGFSASASDFSSPLAGTVTFAAGETSKLLTLAVAADAFPEADEGFTVTLSNPSAGSVGDGSALGTIVNDDGPPPLVTIADVTQSEGNAGTSNFTFTVTRSGGTGAFTVEYATTGGSATAGSDYQHATGMLSFAAGETSKTFTVAVNGDTNAELAESFNVQLSNPTGNAVLADPTAKARIQNDDISYISAIQGSAYYSPILKSEGLNSFNIASETIVVVRAVVSAVDADGSRQGFYLMEEGGDWDANSNTSEGIFVMTRNDASVGSDLATAAPGLQVGDLVTVSARVIEYQAFNTLPRTYLTDMTSLVVNSTGNVVPSLMLDAGRPIPNSIMTLGTPDLTDVGGAGSNFNASLYGMSFWETVEGMLVTIPDMVVADGFIEANGPTVFQAYSTVHADADQINGRGGYTIAGDPPLSPPDTTDSEDDTTAGGRHLHDGDINPDIVELAFTDFAIDAPAGLREQITMGDKLGDVTGIVDFDFTDRRLFVTKMEADGFVNEVPVRETTALGNDGRSLTVATFNVENLWANTSVEGQARFTNIANAIATNLNSPDIIMIEEIQDNNGPGTGTTDASTTWQMLVDAVNAATPGARYQWVDQAPVNNAEGGQGNGNIRVGFLYDTNRVQLGNLAWDAPIEDRRKYTDRIGDGVRDAGDLILFSDDMVASEINTADWTNTRKSLLAQFTFNGNNVFLTANHFTAKGGSGEPWQVDQDQAAGQPENSGWSRRIEQSEDLWHVLNLIQSGAPDARIVTGGDFNDFYFYRPLEVATGYVETDGTARSGGARFDNLTLLLPEAERYSYTYDGRSQALDHILAGQNMAAAATYDIVHINTGFNSLGSGPDGDPSLSDHDPAVASFDFRGFGEVLTGTSGADMLEGFAGDDVLRGLDGADTLNGGDGSDTADFRETAPLGVIVNLSSNLQLAPDGHPQAGRSVGPNEALDGFDNYDSLISIENVITGDGADWVLGSAAANRVETGAGNDRLDGGAGDDVLIGGLGDDIYEVDSLGDVVTELGGAGSGFDTVRTALADYILPANVERLVYTGDPAGPRDVRGNSADNVVDGGSGADIFRLQDGGSDTASGGGGNDGFYFGGALGSTDTVDGGEGQDQLGMQGNYAALALDGSKFASLETFALLSGADARWGDLANNFYDYEMSLTGAWGALTIFNANGLRANEDMKVDASATTAGAFIFFGGFGVETLTGGGQNDGFFFGEGRFDAAADKVNGGAGAQDQIALRGDYSLAFGNGQTAIAGIETIALISANDPRYATVAGQDFDYVITLGDGFASGTDTFTVNGNGLAANETMEVDGSGEATASLRLMGGAGDDLLRGGGGADVIYGGLGADYFTGGGGADTYIYRTMEDSSVHGQDGIGDFALGDMLDLSRVDANSSTAENDAFTFIGGNEFSGQAGELRITLVGGGLWQVTGDVDGNGEADFSIAVVTEGGHNLSASDFIF